MKKRSFRITVNPLFSFVFSFKILLLIKIYKSEKNIHAKILKN